MVKKLILFTVLIIVAGVFGSVNYALKEIDKPLLLEETEIVYEVASGASVKRVLNDFESRGWIKLARLHELWLRYHEKTDIHKGDYLLDSGMTVTAAIEKMIAGDKILRSVRFIEGKSLGEYLVVLAENEFVRHTLTGQSIENITAKVDPELNHHEGWFFPDTYLFEEGTSDLELLKTAHRRMKKVLQEEWGQRADDTMVESPYEALILASIIEKETGAAFERPMISGVFTRRLEKRMRLQTDPTVIYGLGDSFDGNLTRKHLRTDTPYNTYTRSGLPPTPIANPGREAIAAALNPADGDSIFFVAKGDGTHYFSVTLEEHNAAVRKYQRFGRRSDYQSAPADDAEGDNQ